MKELFRSIRTNAIKKVSLSSARFAELYWPLRRYVADRGGLRKKRSHLPSLKESREVVESHRSEANDVPVLILVGGWGYKNLGDDAILYGYVLEAKARGIPTVVASVNPHDTARALAPLKLGVPTLQEAVGKLKAFPGSSRVVVCGGGYLNASWTSEVAGKLVRIRRISTKFRTVLHSVEVRGISDDSSLASASLPVFQRSKITVRDLASKTEIEQILGRSSSDQVSVLPDAISLLYPHLVGFSGSSSRLPARKCFLVNFLDVPARSDANEAEFVLENWVQQCKAILSKLHSKPIGIAMDEDDAHFMREKIGIDVVVPSNPVELIELLRGSEGLISTRMHPALISTMLGKPTMVLPYCGKVRPTLTELGLGDVVMEANTLELNENLNRQYSFEDAWKKN